MNHHEAEAVLALDFEVETALKLLDNEAVFHDDWRTQYAAERAIERIFQAAESVISAKREL